jgi:hypothetical protein
MEVTFFSQMRHACGVEISVPSNIAKAPHGYNTLLAVAG